MEINDYPRSHLHLNKAKQSRLHKAAVTEYKASQAKAQDIKPPGQEQRSVPINKNEHTVIKGEIIDLRYQEVKIRIEPSNQVVTARLSGDVPLSIGQTAEFAVSRESDGQITLRYISTSDTPLNDIIHKALYASALTPTERNLAIVQELLSFQMPVDKDTIHQLIKLTSAYPDINLTTLILMHKNNLPVNASNIAQFESYQNGMHQMISQLNGLIGNISSVLKNETVSPARVEITPAMLDINNHINLDKIIDNENNINLEKILDNKNNISLEKILDNKNNISLENMIKSDNGNTSLGLLNMNIYDPSNDSIHLYKELLTILRDGESIINSITPDTFISDILSDNDLVLLQDTLLNKLSQAVDINSATSKSIMNLPSSGSITVESLFPIVLELYGNEALQPISENNMLPTPILEAFIGVSDYLSDSDRSKLMHLLKSDAYSEFITEVFHQRWTISPKELTERNKVKEFFRHLEDDMEQLSKLTNDSKLFDSENVKATINKLQDNLQFMRDLNELFLYIQLPLRLTKQDVHGDLYVFTRKNKKNIDTDNLNVLLHLDMANLGSMDVHLSMKNNQVNAVFYLEKSSEQIVAMHIGELTQVLANKGYQLQAKTNISECKPDFITDILQQDTPNQGTHRYSFDIRA